MKRLRNKKTTLGVLALGAMLIFRTLFPDVLNDETEAVILTFIGTWTGVSLRLAIRKAQVRS